MAERLAWILWGWLARAIVEAEYRRWNPIVR
jgi:hypothetical protein